MARLLSVNVGLPREVEWKGKTVRTAVWTSAVAGRRKVMKLNVDGDGQGDLVGHGGVSRAVMVYQLDSYRYFGECSAVSKGDLQQCSLTATEYFVRSHRV